MKINLLEIIKELPYNNYEGIGYAVGFADIFSYLKTHHGIDSQDMLNFHLNQMSKDGLLQLHRMDNDSDENDIIIAVSLI